MNNDSIVSNIFCRLHNDNYKLFWALIYFGLHAWFHHFKWLCISTSNLKIAHSAPKIISLYHKDANTFDTRHWKSLKGCQKSDVPALKNPVILSNCGECVDRWYWYQMKGLVAVAANFKNSKFLKHRLWSDLSMVSPVQGDPLVRRYQRFP